MPSEPPVTLNLSPETLRTAMAEQFPSRLGAISPENQEGKATLQVARDTGHTQVVKQESQSPQPVGELPPHNDAVSSSKVAEEPPSLEAVESAMADEPVNREAQMPGIAAMTDDLGTESRSHEAQKSPDADLNPKHALEAGDDQRLPVTTEASTEDKRQVETQEGRGNESSGDFGRKRDAMFKAYENLVDEEAEIEKRLGMPSEKPIDKTRLPILKQELKRIEKALDQNEIIEDMDISEDMNIAEEMKIAQNSIGVPIHALGAVSSKKPASTTRKTTTAPSKKRKGRSENMGVLTKKRRLIPTPIETPKPASKPASKTLPKPPPKQSMDPALKRQLKDADAIGKYTFNQLAGRGTADNDTSDLDKNLPSLRGLNQARSAALHKLRAAAKKIEVLDAPTRKRIDIDIRAIIAMTKPFSSSCSLELLWAEANPDGEKCVDDYAWAIDGMASKLRHHQMMAAGYMCIMERAKKCSGGLLFDYMGYGKTVESLALVVGNPGSKDTKGSGGATTLVVVPSAAAQQWHDEVNLHCPDLVVSLWTNPTNMRSLLASDVLVITYPQLRSAYKQEKKDRQDDEDKPALRHPIFQPKFHRIILDEMHEIKGYRNLTYDAVMALKAEYKWGLTGTPTPNGIAEVFPYLKFIDHPEVTTIREFKKTYVGGQGRNRLPDKLRFDRLRELLAPVMIMRTPSHHFLGATLLKLPKGIPLPPIIVKLSAEERIIYCFIKENIRDHIIKKADMRETKVGWAAYNEGLLRLRQCATCPLLLWKLAKECFWGAHDVTAMKRDARDAGCKTTPFIDQIERWIRRGNLERASTSPGFVMPEQSVADAKAALDRATCPGNGCMKVIAQLTEPQRAECGHVWCKACLEMQIGIEKLFKKKEVPECSRCHKPLGQAQPYSPAEPGSKAAGSMNQGSTPQERPGEDYNGKLPRGSNLMEFLNQDPTVKLPRSGKVDAVIRQVVEWQNQAPEDKIIIFIQWVDLNGILGRILQEEGIHFLYYAGTAEMSDKDRRAAIDTFKEDPFVKVLICSLRCGGQALNLTCANRTIMVDLWWNHSVEAQATARVYRMGQQKETYSVRILVEGSVDEKIYELQNNKLAVVQNAFQEFETDKNLDKETLIKLLGWRRGDLGDEDTDYDDANNDEYDKAECDDADADDEDPEGEYKP